MYTHILIPIEDIEKRIEELKKPQANYNGIYVNDSQYAQIQVLEEILMSGKRISPNEKDIADRFVKTYINQLNKPTND